MRAARTRLRLRSITPAAARDPVVMAALLAAAGGYDGARRGRPATQNWRPLGDSADAALLPDLETLRDRSSDLVRNAPLATGALNTLCTSVVGAGIQPRSTIDRELLRIGPEEADAWESQAQRLFAAWAQSDECDLSRSQTFFDLQDLVFRAVLESGDVFTIHRSVEPAAAGIGIRVQLIEAARVSTPRGDASRSRIVGGIEHDADGAPRAYWVTSRHPGEIGPNLEALTWQAFPAFAEDGRRVIHHHFWRRRPGQSRGIPYLAAVIEPFRSLGRYSEAELQAAVVAAMFPVFVESHATAIPPLKQAGAPSPGQGQLEVANATIAHLLPGEKIMIPPVGRPNEAFPDFVMAVLRQIGVALELPFEVLIKHFTASYSASRAALIEAWRFFQARRAWLVRSFCQPVWDAVISDGVARGLLAAPGFFASPTIRRAYLDAEWTGAPMGQIDPTKDVEAYERMRAYGWITDQRATALLTGCDWEANHVQRVKEERLRARDLPEAAAPRTAPTAPTADPDDQGDLESEAAA